MITVPAPMSPLPLNSPDLSISCPFTDSNGVEVLILSMSYWRTELYLIMNGTDTMSATIQIAMMIFACFIMKSAIFSNNMTSPGM